MKKQINEQAHVPCVVRFMKVSTVEQMRECDSRAISVYGIEEPLLMENAGNAVYFMILKHLGAVRGKRFVVFAGPGNNGGDALVASRKLYSSGAEVKIYLMSAPEKYRGAAKTNYDIVQRVGIETERFSGDSAMVRMEIEAADAIVDGILGTGISRNVEGKYAEAIRMINESGKPVFSVDIPSGINGNTGAAMGMAVRATATVTFGLPKIGSVLYPGFAHGGKLYVSHISFPPENYDRDDIQVSLNEPVPLPHRREDGHKGTFGDTLFVAGAGNYYGAPFFSAMSFLKAGGGYSRLAAPKSLVPHIGAQGREIVFYPMPETDSGSIGFAAKNEILDIAEHVDFMVLGPGMSLHERTQNLIVELVRSAEKPVLVDGDGLTAVSRNLEVLDREHPTILTPHPGEMARLTGLSVSEILKNRIDVARNFATAHGVYLVLKGAHTLVVGPDGEVRINMTGNSGMGTAGSGDVLTGAIAAMYGLGLDIENAVRMGVFVHGLAGDIAAERKGKDGITARDIMESLPEAVLRVRDNYEELKKAYSIEVI